MHSPRTDPERLSRQQAAERLTDLAYALTTGREVELGDDSQRMVRIPDEILLRRAGKANGEYVELALELSWSIAEPVA